MQTILIVDDESQIRSALEGVLDDEGYKTLLAESGEDCLETPAPQDRRCRAARYLASWHRRSGNPGRSWSSAKIIRKSS